MADRLNTAEHDSKGRCIRHPTIRLRKKKFFGGWKTVIGHCPECCLDEMRRVRNEMQKLRQKGDDEFNDHDGTDDDEEIERQRIKREKKEKKKREKRKSDLVPRGRISKNPSLAYPKTGNRGTYTGQINFLNGMPDGESTVRVDSGIIAEGTWDNGLLVESKNGKGMSVDHGNGGDLAFIQRRGGAEWSYGPKSSPPQDPDIKQRIQSSSSQQHAVREVDCNRGSDQSPSYRQQVHPHDTSGRFTGGNLDMLDRLDRRAKSRPNYGSASVQSNNFRGSMDIPSGSASVPIDYDGGGIVNLTTGRSHGQLDKLTKDPHDTSGSLPGGNLDMLDRLDRRAKLRLKHGSTSVRSYDSHASVDSPSGSTGAPIDYSGGGIVNLTTGGSHGPFDKLTKDPHDTSESLPGGNLDMLDRLDRRAKLRLNHGSTSVRSHDSHGSKDDGSKALKIKIIQLESSLKDATFELNKSQRSQEKMILEIGALQAENAELLRRIADNQAQSISEKEVISSELDQLKQENVKLKDSLRRSQSWSETVESYFAEVEAKLKQVTDQRNDLLTRLESSAPADNDTTTQDYNQLYEYFQKELDEKNMEIDRIRRQLIQNAVESDAEMDILHEDLEVEKRRAKLIKTKLSPEKKQLSCALPERHALHDFINIASKNDADTQVVEAQLCISDVEALSCISEAAFIISSKSQVHNFIPLEEKVTSITADRDEIQSHLNHNSEDYENIQALKNESNSIKDLEKSSLEKEHLSSINTSYNGADMLVEEAQLCISDAEALSCISEAQVLNLSPLKEQGTSISADHNDIQSHLNHNPEEYDNIQALKKTKKNSSIKDLEKSSLEKEHLSRTLSERQTLRDSIDASNNDAEMLVDKAQLRISDAEALSCISEAVMALDEQITAITAERDGIQSHLNLNSEEYENIQALKKENSSIKALEKSSLEKEHLSCTLSERQTLRGSVDTSNNDANMQVDEAQLCISDAEALSCT